MEDKEKILNLFNSYEIVNFSDIKESRKINHIASWLQEVEAIMENLRLVYSVTLRLGGSSLSQV